jgi:hypothetical protein
MAVNHRATVEEALAAWRDAERALEDAPHDSREHEDLIATAASLRDRYQQAVLAARGRTDQLEGAAETSWDRLDASADQRAASRDLIRNS